MGNVIYFILSISLSLNVIVCWFIYRSLNRQADLVALVEDLEYKIDIFSKHLENIYELPMYYGEPTIEGLIQHSKILLSSFEQFNNDYIAFNGDDEYEQLQAETEVEE
jgi:hypothetical protein